MASKTLFEKIWDNHLVRHEEGRPDIIYIDRHLVHEVTSPQAFEGLRLTGRQVRQPELTFATMDHNVPTINRDRIEDEIAAKQIETLRKNCKDFGVTLFDLDNPYQGIVHIIGPELGLTLPGLTIVCGDSHTATHGAFGALAFGIGTSEVEHVLATQTLRQYPAQSMSIEVTGTPPQGVTAKDMILAIIGKIGTSGGTGYVVEYRGDAISRLSMEERMTVCNMSIEGGARAGLVALDEKTFAYLKNRPYAPKDAEWDKALAHWKTLYTDEDATFDSSVQLDANNLAPQVTWGTTPAQVTDVTGRIPAPEEFPDPDAQKAAQKALEYMGLRAHTPIEQIPVDRVFIGSCTNGRLSDLQKVAKIVQGKKVSPNVWAIIVPGSQWVKREAEKQGLDRIFIEAGFEWRESGCSMCLGMNPDILKPGERCASTSNRNFEGRQGRGGRTHLVSPETAAATAIYGHFVDVRQLV